MGSYRVDRLHAHPKSGLHYVVGADASGGTGNDEAAIEILCLETFEEVFSFADNRMDPVEFGYFSAYWGKKYNTAYIVPEGNNHGIATCSILKKNYNRGLIYKRNIPTKAGKVAYGFYTGDTTKKELTGYILEAIECGLVLYCPETCSEMNKFEEDPNGRMGASTVKATKSPGADQHRPQDGRVIALALACFGYFKRKHLIRLPPPEKPKPLISEHFQFVYDPYEWMEEAAKKRASRGTEIFPRMVN